jgi:hypothetical protein
MKTTTHTVRRRAFRSEVRPDVETTDRTLAAALEWADGNPVVWEIVSGHRSKAFGLGSCEYIGWAQRRREPDAMLERVRHIHGIVSRPERYLDPGSIFPWRARFTLDRFREKGFTGGFFQQWDADFPRSCLTLDYTPETLEEVVDRFCGWMDRYYRSARVTLNGETVRTLAEG